MVVDGGRRAHQTLALTVHGPAGAVDLVVPAEASVADVAREYAAKAGLQFAPRLHDRRGAALDPAASLSSLGLPSGAVLAAGGAIRRHAGDQRPQPVPEPAPGPLAAAWCAVAAAAAVLAGWFASTVGPGTAEGRAAVGLLVLSAAVGVLPAGRLSSHRAVAAPAFAGAAAWAVLWSPEPARLPTVVGVTALVAAVAAAVARALDVQAEEALRVWMTVGVALFVVTAGGALLHLAPQVVWGVLLLLATLAARFVPVVAVDVPDQLLVDRERLAVSAWSARERPHGRRGRMVVPPAAVAQVAARGTRLLTAAAAAIWVVTALAAPMLLASAALPVDRVGARVMVLLCGAALLLAARSYRHPTARTLLRGAGVTCWVALCAVLLRHVEAGQGLSLAVVVVLLALLLVAIGVATGRGWRSGWWSRRAEVAEGLAGAGAIAAVVVASGLFRALWEIKFRV